MTRNRRIPTVRAFRGALLAASLLFANACGDFARLVTPGRPDAAAPARVAFTASVARNIGTAADVVTLRVTTSYARISGAPVLLDQQSVTLSDARTQQVPLSLDIGPCLRDVDHLGESATTGADVCTVYLVLVLQINGTTIDQSTVGPLRVKAGSTNTVSSPVTLYELASFGVAPVGGTVLGPNQRLSLTLGSSLALEAQLRDAAGRLVTDRPVTWTSDAPAVASVNATSGLVTSVAAGTARITASASVRTASATVDVTVPTTSLTVSALAGTGTGAITSQPAGINCRILVTGATGTCAFNFVANSQVTLSATPDAGMQFGPWGDMCGSFGSAASCTLTMSQVRTVSARFNALRRLTVTSAGTGNGRITSAPAGIDCQLTGATTAGTCVMDVVDGTSITLTGAAAAQHVLAGWTGDCANASGTSCTLVMTGAARSAGVRFVEPQLLTVTPSGTGTGIVSASGGIACTRGSSGNSGVCAATYSFNTIVTLTARADTNSTFAGWSGACASTQSSTCIVTMDQARSVGVVFNRGQVALSLSLVGAGSGSLTVNGATACTKTVQQTSNQCIVSLDVGTVVQLVAQPDAQTTFNGYSGACAGTLAQCTVVMTGAKAVTASFFATSVQVSVVNLLPSNANGTVQSSSGVINCNYSAGVASGACTTTIPTGSTISLTATAGLNSAFVQWGGACAGIADSQCVLSPTTSVSLSAKFNTGVTISLTVNAALPGAVTFSAPGFPAQSACVVNSDSLQFGGRTCDYRVPVGATVTFTIVPGVGGSGQFDVPCPTSGLTCTIVANTNLSISASIYESSMSIRKADNSENPLPVAPVTRTRPPSSSGLPLPRP